ncbi:FMN-dependent dehydrogenase, includes L-lactate dehydrogenase and type II isopentenyl diphosphate isomerase [Anaerobranca californiensis DSM 14826]|uniref:L-lactate oxidase n=1 Tax=Anaerobranca californiensis DSM 14826 TaxID=1120989 RepID=A0A1M6RRU2_9FIRM|nr:alpha-hydroxy-acid oxidizing protein [Anaerobranca californiensis]SHK35222.1 FMN-dependent dehydrogenase, includes L-lactate dehydrogenase and type II isopentenyl diphosphate isomerase [Anaerobranca californiensis DSM 14826]
MPTEIRKKARELMTGYCKVCPVCDGRACKGQVPGMGGVGSGSSFWANLESLGKVKLNMRTIHDKKDPDTSTTIFGRKISLPVMVGPMTGTTYNMGGKVGEKEFVSYLVEGSLKAGSLAMTGDGADPTMYNSGLEAIREFGGGIPIIKPRSQQEIISRIKEGEKAGAVAIGVDIDGAGLVTMALKGQPVGPKTVGELKELVQSTHLPFILKGIMTADEAELAVEIGAAAIVVSNHGGRVLDSCPGAAEVLPEIAKKVKGKITIFADGGIRTGTDVLKMLALGADCVLIGRPFVIQAFGGGAQGVEEYYKTIQSQLYGGMILTGCGTIGEIDERIIRY